MWVIPSNAQKQKCSRGEEKTLRGGYQPRRESGVIFEAAGKPERRGEALEVIQDEGIAQWQNSETTCIPWS